MPKCFHDNLMSAEEQALSQSLQDEWHEELLPLLPGELAKQAREFKAFERANGLAGPADLLRGILAYAFCLPSFRQVGSWAASLGISGNGERSWAKRTRQARLWLLWLLCALLLPTEPRQEPRGLPPKRRVLLVDASNLRGWRKAGAHHRLHVSYDLQAQRIAQVVLSDQKTGERLSTLAFEPGDILVADRGYCRRQGLFDALQAGGEIVVRLHWNNVPLQDEEGHLLDVCHWVQSLQANRGEQMVWMHVRKQRVRLRLLAVRLTPEAASRAQRRHQQKMSRNGSRSSHPWTLVLTDWLLVLSSLEATVWSAELVLELYRARWQIELLFKRIKQLVRVHRLRSDARESNEATLAALLVGWALVEQQAARLREQLAATQDAPAQEAASGPLSSWEVEAVLVQSLRSMILGGFCWSQIQQKLEQIRRLLTVHPQARLHQESTILAHLEQILVSVQTEVVDVAS